MAIVKATKEHRAFVLSTWLRSKWDLLKGTQDYDTYIRNEPPLAEERFSKGYVWVDTPDGYAISGWLAGRELEIDNGLTGEKGITPVVFHMYVAPELRGRGLGNRLIRETVGPYPEVIVCVDEIRAKRRLEKTKLLLGTWNPYRTSEK